MSNMTQKLNLLNLLGFKNLNFELQVINIETSPYY